jgi:hypothetical protein
MTKQALGTVKIDPLMVAFNATAWMAAKGRSSFATDRFNQTYASVWSN